MDFEVNGSTRATIDSSGRLLVGTTLSQAHASANLVEIGNYTLTNAGITINSPTSGAGLINFGDSAASNRRGRIEYTHASDAFRFYTADAERVRVTSAGNVGIGAASPSAILHTVASASFDPTNVSDFTGVGLFLQSPSGIAGDGNFGSALAWSRPEDSSRFKTAIAPVQEGSDQDRQGLAFFTADDASALVAPEERLRISNTGRVGIGTTSPGDLNVNANNLVVGSGSGSEGMTIYSGTANNGNIFFADGTGANAYAGYIQFSHNADIMKFGIQGQDAMYIDSSRRVLIGTSSALTGGGTQFGKFVLLGNSSGANSSGIVVIGRNAAATSLVAGNTVGEIYFGDTAAAHFASISCAADASTGSGDYPGRLVFSTTADGASSPTERMRIDSAGRVGIGVAAPLADVHIKKATKAQLMIQNTANSAKFGSEGSDVYIAGTSGGSNIIFKKSVLSDDHPIDSGTETVRIDSSGRLLVGTSSLSTDLATIALFQGYKGSPTSEGIIYISRGSAPGTNDDIGSVRFSASNHTLAAMVACKRDGGTWTAGSSQPTLLSFSTTADGASSPTERMRITNNGRLRIFSSSNIAFEIGSASSSGTVDLLFSGNYSASGIGGGTESIRIFTNGNVENTNDSYGQISDIKLKENIVDAGSQWDDFKAVRFRKYNFKEETGYETHTQLGVIAQELELVSPGLVYETPDRDDEGNDLGTTTKAVKSSILVKKALVALQEAMDRIEQLEAKVAALEAS
jgi:hypothetical protein